MRTEGAPRPDQVESGAQEALYATRSFARDGERNASGRLTYDLREVSKKDGSPVIDLVLFGSLEETGGEMP